MRRTATVLVLALLLALAGGGTRRPPPTPVEDATLEVRQLQARVARAATDLTAATRRLDASRRALAEVRRQRADAEREAEVAAARAGAARDRLSRVVAAAYRSPVPDAFVLVLSGPDAFRAVTTRAGRPRAREGVDRRPRPHGRAGAGAGAVGRRPRRGARARRRGPGRGGRPVAGRPAGAGAGHRPRAAQPRGPGSTPPGWPPALVHRHADRSRERVPAAVRAVPAARARRSTACAPTPPPTSPGSPRRPWPSAAPRCASPTATGPTPARSTSSPASRGSPPSRARRGHGLGVALDLGCGVESFGTEAHRWMQANGPRFGWVHPGLGRAGRQHARALALGARGLTPVRRSARGDEQALRADADRPVEVRQHASSRGPRRPSEMAVVASTQTHSPTASRCRCTVSSGLMKCQVATSSSLESPLPLSATASTRVSGLGSSSGTSGWRSRVHAVAGPSAPKRPSAKRHSTADR